MFNIYRMLSLAENGQNQMVKKLKNKKKNKNDQDNK